MHSVARVKMELQHNGAMADGVRVFEIINLTDLAEWNSVKQYITFSEF